MPRSQTFSQAFETPVSLSAVPTAGKGTRLALIMLVSPTLIL